MTQIDASLARRLASILAAIKDDSFSWYEEEAEAALTEYREKTGEEVIPWDRHK